MKAFGHFLRKINSTSIKVEDMDLGLFEVKLLVPQRRVMLVTDVGNFIISTRYKMASTVSPGIPAFSTLVAGSNCGYDALNYSMFFVKEFPIRTTRTPSISCDSISFISATLLCLLFGSSALKVGDCWRE